MSTFRGSRDNRSDPAPSHAAQAPRELQSRRFYVLLVDTFDCRFIGDRYTSLLLISADSRLRAGDSPFFERWHEEPMTMTNDPERCAMHIQDARARQPIEHNMDWMEQRGRGKGGRRRRHGTRRREALWIIENKARVQRFYSDWDAAKKKLNSQLPKTFEGLTPELRAQARTAIVDFLTAHQGAERRVSRTEHRKICREDANKCAPRSSSRLTEVPDRPPTS